MTLPALLLDRDGIVNVDHGYVGDRSRFTFMAGIFETTRRAFDLGFRVAIVTNQSGIARGFYTEEDFSALSGWITAEFRRHGVELAGIFHCPFHRGGTIARYARDSFWRKPAPGMILEAAKRLDLDLGRSVFLGDQPTDMEAAAAAGVGLRVLLIGKGEDADVDADAGRQAGADLTIRRLSDLMPILTDWTARNRRGSSR